jgi:predicted nucleotidyltransferase
MTENARKRVTQAAAQFLVDGSESEYLQAKERAQMMLGLSGQSRLPSNRKIKNCIAHLTAAELGADEVNRRVREMREIAEQIMIVIEEYDPFLIGSTLSGQVRHASDIDLHAYCDDFTGLQDHLIEWGYEDVDEEVVENRKGKFVHLKWRERDYPVEVTVYPWSWRDVIMYSSVTGKPMKRADLKAVRKLLGK